MQCGAILRHDHRSGNGQRIHSRAIKNTFSAKSNLARLIYIGGYGRSGSTLFESLLTADPRLVACGEVSRHLWRTKIRKTCTCGRGIKTCPVWQPFRHRRKRIVDWDHLRLTLALLDHISTNFSVMVDCSKTAWGSGLAPFRLRKRLGSDFLLMHLVRDPRAVCWSTLRTKNQHAEPGSDLGANFRTAFGWLGANLACEAFRLFHPNQYLRIRYEDIVRAPQTTLPSIFKAAALHPASSRQEPATDNRHQLHGNRVRHQPVVLGTLKEDLAWKARMPWSSRWLIVMLTAPLFLKYSFHIHVQNIKRRKDKAPASDVGK